MNEKAEAERDAALAAIERVRAVAMQHRSVEQHNEMVAVTDIADLIREPASADYLAALDGAPEPEWEYARKTAHGTVLIADSSLEEARERVEIAGGERYQSVVRRRPAGPWLPVEGEKL